MRIPTRAVRALSTIAIKFLPVTKVPEPGRWRNLNDDQIWKDTIYQVAVVGGSSSVPRLQASNDAQKALKYERLRGLNHQQRLRTINRVLRATHVRYASSDVAKCHKSMALSRNFDFLSSFTGGPRGYLKSLATLSDDNARIVRVEGDMSYIKLKGARDFLAGLGLVTDMIAFDVRLLKILRSVGIELPPDVATNSNSYKLLQDALIAQVCVPLRINGVALDRILYQNYEQILPKGTGRRERGTVIGCPLDQVNAAHIPTTR